MAVAGLEAGAALLFLHVPGTRMVEEGVDGASREGAKRIIGATCTTRARATITELLRQNDWELSIVLLAAKLQQDDRTVRIVDRRVRKRGGRCFHHPFLEPVSVPVRPPSSGLDSGDLLHLSPVGLARATVKRARSDGIRCVFVVPTAYKGRILDGAQGPLNRSSGADTSGS